MNFYCFDGYPLKLNLVSDARVRSTRLVRIDERGIPRLIATMHAECYDPGVWRMAESTDDPLGGWYMYYIPLEKAN